MKKPKLLPPCLFVLSFLYFVFNLFRSRDRQMVYSGLMNIHCSNSMCIVRPIWLRRRDDVDTDVWFAFYFERCVQIHQISVDVKNSF